MILTEDVEELKNTIKQLGLINIYRTFPYNFLPQCTGTVIKVHQILGHKTNLKHIFLKEGIEIIQNYCHFRVAVGLPKDILPRRPIHQRCHTTVGGERGKGKQS